MRAMKVLPSFLHASQACLDLIKRFEDEAGFRTGRCTRTKAYKCPSGVWTIGWGHTRGVFEGMEITSEMADEFLLEDIFSVEMELRSLLNCTPLTQSQWDALVSLCFNLRGGPRALPKIAPKLYRALKAGDDEAAAREFLDIVKANGTVLPGLVLRRQLEAALFLSDSGAASE